MTYDRGSRSHQCLPFAAVAVLLATSPLVAQEKLKLWLDSTAIDTFACGGLVVRLLDYDRDDLWLGHVFQLRVTNRSDSVIRFDPTTFTALLRDGTQQTFPSADDLAERALTGWKAKRELKSPTAQDRKRAELRTRRDLVAEGLLPGAASAKRIALGPSPSGGIAIGGRSAEAMREYRAADLPLTLYCGNNRVGVVSKPIDD